MTEGMGYDPNSPLSENAQDSLIHGELRAGGLPGVAQDETLAELSKAGYLTARGFLTAKGAREGKRLWRHYFGEGWKPGQ